MESEKKQEKHGVQRTRNYAFILYADSAPGNWKEILEDTHVPMLISPYHDRDVNPDGTQKKPHWHVFVMFDSVKTKKQFEELRNLVNGVGSENIQSSRGYARYLCHLDSPEKAKYEKKDVLELNGADYEQVMYRPTDDILMLGEMMEYCKEHKIDCFAEFAMDCKENNPDWFVSLAHRTTYFMDKFIKSLSWAAQKRAESGRGKLMYLVNPETGEKEREIYV